MSGEISNAKHKFLDACAAVNEKILEQFGFRIQDVTLDRVLDYFYSPKDSSSLAVTRILFGLAMLFDIPDERGGAAMIERWGNPTTCHFPLVPFVRAVPMPYMALVYAALWLGALGIAVGYKYHISSITFVCCYWYLFLIEKSYWNNHSYLFGLVAVLLSFTDAHCYWSIDAILDSSIKQETVPYWNYFILKYQFFVLYFMAGLKKGTAEWLTGYSVQNLSEHWVFSPFKLFLTVPQTDYLVVHWFVFVFDLTVAFWMMWGRMRHFAMVFCALFHLMNSRLFSIGMFPWVCLATMPLYYPFDWPKTVRNFLNERFIRIKKEVCRCVEKVKTVKCGQQTAQINEADVDQSKSDNPNYEIEKSVNGAKEETFIPTLDKTDDKEDTSMEGTKNSADLIKEGTPTHDDVNELKAKESKDKLNDFLIEKKCKSDKLIILSLIIFHIITQAFLPFSHFITKGYNNWTNGLYGYSWDMMVHTWDTDSVAIKIIDNEKNSEFFIDPYVYAPNERWTRHGDMLYQYVHCIRDNLILQSKKLKGKDSKNALSNNISIYVDVWCSMNGRFTQRMFDPKVDLLRVSWSPFEPISYLMPLIDDALVWRGVLQDIRKEVHSWHNGSDVIFIADFPGYEQEKYIPTDLDNVTLTILEGSAVYEPELSKNYDGQSLQLTTGTHIKLQPGTFHKVINIGDTPAYYMYTFINTTDTEIKNKSSTPKLPIFRELLRRFRNMVTFTYITFSNILQTFLKVTQCQPVIY